MEKKIEAVFQKFEGRVTTVFDKVMRWAFSPIQKGIFWAYIILGVFVVWMMSKIPEVNFLWLIILFISIFRVVSVMTRKWEEVNGKEDIYRGV